MIAVLIAYLAVKDKKQKWDDNNIKTRQQRDRDEVVLPNKISTTVSNKTAATHLQDSDTDSDDTAEDAVATYKITTIIYR